MRSFQRWFIFLDNIKLLHDNSRILCCPGKKEMDRTECSVNLYSETSDWEGLSLYARLGQGCTTSHSTAALQSSPCPKAPVPTPFSSMKKGTFNFSSSALKVLRSLILSSWNSCFYPTVIVRACSCLTLSARISQEKQDAIVPIPIHTTCLCWARKVIALGRAVLLNLILAADSAHLLVVIAWTTSYMVNGLCGITQGKPASLHVYPSIKVTA